MSRRVCIIGAGSSGMTVAKSLLGRGIEPVVYEKGSDIGGMWRYGNDNGQSACYASLHIDTSRPNLGYTDFPLDERLPDFPSHAQFLTHLERYAEAFDLRRLVQFNTEVANVTAGDGYSVRLTTGETQDFTHVIVANGHLWDARRPDFPGGFDGPQIHSFDYRTAEPFDGMRVLVVGIGNSAVDIAVDLSRRAQHVYLSTRRSAWVMPKYLAGRPIDQVSGAIARRLRLSTPATRRIMAGLVRFAQGDQRRFGLPRPEHPMWREHATLSHELLPAIGHGYVSVKPDVQRLDGTQVVFADASREPVDAIIYATGYNVTFPFLGPDLMDPGREAGMLYRRMISPRHPGLIFAGLVQPIGPTIPLVEIQGQWIAAWLSGAMRLPDRDGQGQEIDAHRAYQAKTYLDSARYVLEVDYRRYVAQMRRDMEEGAAGTA